MNNVLYPEDELIISYLIRRIKEKFGGLLAFPEKFTAGITNDPYRRKIEHKNPEYFYFIDCYEEKIAREVEKYLLNLGMKGDTGGGDKNSRFVYIF